MPGLLMQQPTQEPQLLGSGLTMGGSGLAPFGVRYAGQGVKGKGFFGLLSRPDGQFSSELSSEFDHNGKNIEHPLMVPTLSSDELNLLLSGGQPTPGIYDKAQSYALSRIAGGFSPFAGPGELHYPVPK